MLQKHLSEAKNIVLLYTELAGYTVECLNAFATENEDGFRLHVVRYPVNPEAPFQFEFHPSIEIHEKEDVNSKRFLSLQPDLVIVSGWADSEYNNWVTELDRQVVKVIMFDNFWENTPRQNLGRFLLKPFLNRRYDFCWVPGRKHLEYTRRLGFLDTKVKFGMYATNLAPFFGTCEMRLEGAMPVGSFLYVGRYLKIKGVEDLWKAFETYRNEGGTWDLHLAGAGELWDNRPMIQGMHHHGFMQKAELLELTKRCSVFVMPSHYDHWGMAVQEFAASGFPLILSDNVAAGTDFLKPEQNGVQFRAGNAEELCVAFHEVAGWEPEKLRKAGKLSRQLSDSYNTQTWSKTLKWFTSQKY